MNAQKLLNIEKQKRKLWQEVKTSLLQMPTHNVKRFIDKLEKYYGTGKGTARYNPESAQRLVHRICTKGIKRLKGGCRKYESAHFYKLIDKDGNDIVPCVAPKRITYGHFRFDYYNVITFTEKELNHVRQIFGY